MNDKEQFVDYVVGVWIKTPASKIPIAVTMPAPICCRCQVEMRCCKNGQLVNDVRAGQLPPTYWASDLFACPCCDIEIATGFQLRGTSAVEQRQIGHDVDNSITFAYSPEQREKYADQFSKREAVDA